MYDSPPNAELLFHTGDLAQLLLDQTHVIMEKSVEKENDLLSETLDLETMFSLV